MKISLSSCLIAVFALCAAVSSARIEQSVVDGNLVVQYFSTADNLYRTETTQQVTGQPYQFKTTFTGAWEYFENDADLDKLLGTVEHTTITEISADGETRYTTKNVHYDALGNYVKTSYSVIVLDNAGNLVNIIWGSTLSAVLDVRSRGNDRTKVEYKSVTVGIEVQ